MAVLRMIGVSTRSLQRNLQLQRGAAFRVNNLTHAPAAWGFAMSCQHQLLDQDPHHKKKHFYTSLQTSAQATSHENQWPLTHSPMV